MRSHYCGEITSKELDHEVTICGWIHKRRDHGGVIFLDVRDIKGVCQAVINPDNAKSFAIAESLRNEYVVQISGVVKARLEGAINVLWKSSASQANARRKWHLAPWGEEPTTVPTEAR